MEERWYALHNYFHVTGGLDPSGAVKERYGYNAYGDRRSMHASYQSVSSTSSTSEVSYGAYVRDKETGFLLTDKRLLVHYSL